MCCSVSPGERVRFSNTVLYAAEAVGPGGGVVHALGYQNRVGRRSPLAGLARRLRGRGTGNAMILPFPAVAGTMGPANVVDTSECRDALQNIARAVDFPEYPVAAWGRGMSEDAVGSVQVFEAAGIYTVVLARNAADIPGALGGVPAEKRPALNPALFDAYARWYPGWTVALCCFDARRAALADPLLWWYEPLDPSRLFLPALDCHTGDVPDLTARVAVDHVVAVGSRRMIGGTLVSYDNSPGPAAPYLMPTVVGRRYRERMPNGDFVCRADDVAAGVFAPERCPPPAA